MQALHEAGANVTVRGPGGATPLHLAAKRQDSAAAEIIRFLVGAGADVNFRDERGWTPLHTALRFGSTDTVEALLKCRADVDAETPEGLRPVHIAGMARTAEPLRLVLAAGADPNEPSPDGFYVLESVLCYSSIAVAGKSLKEALAKTPPESFCAWVDDMAAASKVESLLAAGEDPNAVGRTGWTPLMLASRAWDMSDIQRFMKPLEKEKRRRNASCEALAFGERHDPTEVLTMLAAAGAKRVAESSVMIETDYVALRSDAWRGPMLEVLKVMPIGEVVFDPQKNANPDGPDAPPPDF